VTDVHMRALANFHDGIETYTIFYIAVGKKQESLEAT